MSFTPFECFPVKYYIYFYLSSRFYIINVIPRADRFIRTKNIISSIRAQISTVSRRLQNIMRVCVRNL